MSPLDKVSEPGERGAVLLTTLLVMAVMATLSVAILEDLRFAVKRAVNMGDHAQADWYVDGAEAFAETLVNRALSDINADDLDDYLLGLSDSPFVFPLDGGSMTLSMRDGGDCVSIGALSLASVQTQFTQLLKTLGKSDYEAEIYTSKVMDWQDTDSTTRQNGAEDYSYLGFTPAYRTANIPFGSVSELRSVEGVRPEDIIALKPYLCARPNTESPKVSINTLPLEKARVLAALITDSQSLSLATQLIQDRPDGGYTEDQLKLSPTLEGVEPTSIAYDLISYKTEHIWVEAQILVGQSVRYLAMEFALDGDTFKPSFRRRSAEAFRTAVPLQPETAS